jgi:hypothetical protein
MDDLCDVKIERRGGTIPLEFWEQLIASDEEPQPVETLEGRHPSTGKVVRVAAPHSALWLAHPQGVPYVFRYTVGTITARSLDQHATAKASQIASRLDATPSWSID